MGRVGMIIASEGRNVDILVQSEKVELGSILKIGDFYGIVAEMHYQEDEKVGSKQKLIAGVQIFGRLTDGRLKSIKRPVEPYMEVDIATGNELENMLKCRDSVSIGNVYGTDARGFLNANEYDRHMAILASTGAGKSYACATLIKEFSRLGLPVIVVDTHGEYQRLVGKLAETDDVRISVYTVKQVRQGCERFRIPVSGLEPADFNHFAYLTEPQESAIGMIIDKLSGKDYLLEDLINECDTLDLGVVQEGTVHALKRKLITLEKVFKDVFDRYGTDISKLVAPGTVTIIDSSLAPQGVRRSVVSYLSKELLRGRINKINNLGDMMIDHRLLFVIEEAHNYGGSNLSHSCKYQLQRVASEGRKFGIGLCVISQRPSKIDEEILSQCNTGIYMHITNPKDKEHIKRSFECINDAIVNDLDGLDVGECIIAGAMLDIPFMMCKIDRIEIEEERKSKFDFKVPSIAKVGRFDYV